MLRWFRARRFIKSSQYWYSSVSPPVVNVKTSNDDKLKEGSKTNSKTQNNSVSKEKKLRLIAAAFASLKELQKPSSVFDQQISSASDINSLLSVADGPVLAKEHAIKIVTILATWANTGKISLADFQTDTRFAKICRILGRKEGGNTNGDMGDLSVVLGVTADEQAAKLISSINLQQMLKILSSLSVKKRRSTPLLRSLAFNIGKTSEKLNIKEASDVFYAIASLNYHDEVLLEKVCDDIRTCLKDNEKPAVISSIITSMGLLRYRDTDLLDLVCQWIIENKNLCRTKDFVSLLLTLASVNYIPESFSQFYKILEPHLNESEMVEITTWVDVVWSLIVLNKCDKKLIDSVLQPEFVSRLISKKKKNNETETDVSRHIKLLNINGAAKHLDIAYKGHFLDEDSIIFKTLILRTKEKQYFLDSVTETLSDLIKIEGYIKTDVNSRSGFLIDAVCLLDSKSNFVKLCDESKENNTKIAIMTSVYHDFCRGCHDEVTGATALIHRLVRGMGYQILSIPYNEYSPKEKLIDRVQYLNRKLKESVNRM